MQDYLARFLIESFNFPNNIIVKPLDIDENGRYWMLSNGQVLSVCREQPHYKVFQEDRGYKYIKANGKKLYLHRLYAMTFNVIPEKEMLFNNCEVHHLDFNKYNNELSNLCILTPEKHRAIHSIQRKLKKWEKENNI